MQFLEIVRIRGSLIIIVIIIIIIIMIIIIIILIIIILIIIVPRHRAHPRQLLLRARDHIPSRLPGLCPTLVAPRYSSHRNVCVPRFLRESYRGPIGVL